MQRPASDVGASSLSRQSGVSDAKLCEAITRHHARTFSIASRFLTAEKRRAAYAIYAFCRIADDIADEAETMDEDRTRSALASHREQLVETMLGRPGSPVFRELSWAIRRFGIPERPFHDLLDMLHQDLMPSPPDSWEELERYCDGVASTVGEMCAHIFGLAPEGPARVEALRQARILGVALQLTNILRDVGEDAERGRCYLPAADLARFGLTRADVLERRIDSADPRWQALIRYEIERARTLYVAASPGLSLVDDDARCCATICVRGYASILGAIERRAYDSLAGRARVRARTKIRVVLSAWCESRWALRTPLRYRIGFGGVRRPRIFA